jgi:hypothetical protein
MYVVFLYNKRDNTFGNVIESKLTKDDAKSLRDKLVGDGLPAFFELESTMVNKYKLTI